MVKIYTVSYFYICCKLIGVSSGPGGVNNCVGLYSLPGCLTFLLFPVGPSGVDLAPDTCGSAWSRRLWLHREQLLLALHVKR